MVDRPGTFSIADERFHLFGLLDETETPDKRQAYIQLRHGRIDRIDGPRRVLLPRVELASLGGTQGGGTDQELRTPRRLDEFPDHLVNAVLAMEDSQFWEHGGVSYTGILRALYANVKGRRQGGSTITQQLAKNLFLNPAQTLERKFNELFYALALEHELSKEEILTLYLNEIYWGQANGRAICGADSAAKTYFGKPVEQLNLAESATLAGIISAPNAYSPIRSPEKAIERRNIALSRMIDVGAISQHEADDANELPLQVRGDARTRQAPYAVDTILDWSAEQLGDSALARSGLRIRSTIHPLLQRRAEEAVSESLDELRKRVPDAQMALVAIDPQDGRILALVGGSDYAETPYNRALLAQRQLGSTIKPLTLLRSFEEDPSLSPATLIEDAPIQRAGPDGIWEPKNYDGKFRGLISLREAIASSRNIPAVLMAERLGYGELKSFFHRIGLDQARDLPSTALGAFEASPLDIAEAYSLFVNGGAIPRTRILDQIHLPEHQGSHDDQTARWEILLETRPASEQLVSARAAAMARSVLQSVIAEGTGSSAVHYGIGNAAGGKTGTTNQARDAWFAGISPELSVAVWAGRDSGAALGVSGSKAALPAWARFMNASGTTSGRFETPPSVVSAETCIGDWTMGQCNECGLELYTAGEEPQGGCGVRGYFWDLKRRWEPIVDQESAQEIQSNLLPF
jgi:penicillin-binding protein 1B